MSLDPFPGTENETLETRLRVLFNTLVRTVEPERDGLWYIEATKQLALKINGVTVKFNSVS